MRVSGIASGIAVCAVLASVCAGCTKGDDCVAIRHIGGVFGLGDQPKIDETNAGKRLWYWVDASYPRLSPDKISKLIYSDGSTGFELWGVSSTQPPPPGSAGVLTNQSISMGIGADIAVDPARAVENYEDWGCRVFQYNPQIEFYVWCPVLKYVSNKREVAAPAACKQVHVGDRPPRTLVGTPFDCLRYDRTWTKPWPAGLPKPPYERSVDDARDAFNALALKAGYPVKPDAIVARSILDVIADQNNSPGCYDGKGPPGNPPPPQGTAPPGAESPDAGGVVVPPGMTPGDGSGSGDYP